MIKALDKMSTNLSKIVFPEICKKQFFRQVKKVRYFSTLISVNLEGGYLISALSKGEGS